MICENSIARRIYAWASKKIFANICLFRCHNDLPQINKCGSETGLISKMGSRFQKTVSMLVLFTLVAAACDVEFEPDIEPLIIEGAGDQPFSDELDAQADSMQVPLEETQLEEDSFSEFSSSDAMALCGTELSWGDETVGICLAPGGDTYFVWTDDDNVIRVTADPTDVNQAIFLQAAKDRVSAVEEIDSQKRTLLLEGLVFGVSFVGLIPACVTIVGCAIDAAVVLGSRSLLAESGNSIVTSIQSGESATKSADYSYCRMTGGTDEDCRASAGITDELEGE